MIVNSTIQTGMNGRFHSENKQTARDEIVFAKMAGFSCIQFPGMASGLDVRVLGDPLDVVGVALRRARITAVMEMDIPLYCNGLTAEGAAPMDFLQANLPAIHALQCTHVHWQIVPAESMEGPDCRELERNLLPQIAEAVSFAQKHRFAFGIEHNAPDAPLFHQPEVLADLLTAVPGLGFVWDFNHTAQTDFAAFAVLAPHMNVVHVSDTCWPEVNQHLPLGMGNLDFNEFLSVLFRANFAGPAILEIGGMPKSGGIGQDTNGALFESGMQFSNHISTLFA